MKVKRTAALLAATAALASTAGAIAIIVGQGSSQQAVSWSNGQTLNAPSASWES